MWSRRETCERGCRSLMASKTPTLENSLAIFMVFSSIFNYTLESIVGNIPSYHDNTYINACRIKNKKCARRWTIDDRYMYLTEV